MEPQTVGKLRAAGWKVQADIPSDYVLRVYDLRLDMSWLRRTLPALGLSAGDLYFVGGDFLQAPHKEDAVALADNRLTRWGPEGTTPYHLVVPPRRHFARLVDRARLQLPMEAFNSWLTLTFVVPRSACPQTWTTPAVLQALPQLEPLLADPNLEVRVVAVGERPLVVRIPADVQELPPPRWESGQLAVDRVLIFVSIRSNCGERVTVAPRWLREPPPALPPSELELLRLEYVLPPATKAAAAERALRATVRKVASIVVPGELSPVQLRQVQEAHGVAYALMGVPTAMARAWLRGSGCEGLYIRPFWTASTGKDVQRDKFSLLWVKAPLEAGPRLWQELQDISGVFGLYVDGKDLAIRVTAEADRALLQAKVNFVLRAPTTLRSAEPGVQWWRLGPLREAELWKLKTLIAGLGLELVRAELRLASLGPFRSAVFFPARGVPTKFSLDDGSWTASAAVLTKADPPARRRGAGVALAPQSTWGGPRTSTSTPPPGVSTGWMDNGDFPVPASTSTPTVQFAGAGLPMAMVTAGTSGDSGVPTMSLLASNAAPSGGVRGGKGGRGGRGGRAEHPERISDAGAQAPVAAPADSVAGAVAMMAAQIQSMGAQIAAMSEELRELRKENVQLRRQVDLARGVQQHNPYDLPTVPPPPPAFSPPRLPTEGMMRTAGQLTPVRVGDIDPDGDVVVATSPPPEGEPKRARRGPLNVDGIAGSHAAVEASLSSSSTPSGAAPAPDV